MKAAVILLGWGLISFALAISAVYNYNYVNVLPLVNTSSVIGAILYVLGSATIFVSISDLEE